MSMDDNCTIEPRKTRRRRRVRRGGKKKNQIFWFDFAPRVTDDNGNALDADEELGFPVNLPSGQSVYLLHEAANPQFAATYLPETLLRPHHDQHDDDNDSASACSEITSASWDLPEGCFRFDRNDSAESGVSCSTMSSEGASSVGESLGATSSSSSTILSTESSWKNFHDCLREAAAASREDCRCSELPEQPWDHCAAELAAAARRCPQPCTMISSGDVAWRGFPLICAMSNSSHIASTSSLYESDIDFPISAYSEAAFIEDLVDEEDGRPESEHADLMDCTSVDARARRSRKEKKEARRAARAAEAEAKEKAEREARRLAHEKREKRNQAKAERRSRNKTGPVVEDEVDVALRELGV